MRFWNWNTSPRAKHMPLQKWLCIQPQRAGGLSESRQVQVSVPGVGPTAITLRDKKKLDSETRWYQNFTAVSSKDTYKSCTHSHFQRHSTILVPALLILQGPGQKCQWKKNQITSEALEFAQACEKLHRPSPSDFLRNLELFYKQFVNNSKSRMSSGETARKREETYPGILLETTTKPCAIKSVL